MSRSQPSRGGEGAVRGTGPLAGSADSHIDHHADRQELWGDVRDSYDAMPERTPNRGAGTPPISDEEAAEAYRLSRTTDLLYREIAERVGISKSAVGRIARREGRFGQMDAIAEVMLEIEEERQDD